jgi:hypothetical protein
MATENELLTEAVSLLRAGVRGAAGVETGADLRHYPLHCIPAQETCRRVIYSTKGDWLIHLNDDSVPKDVTILWRVGPLTASHRALVRAVVGRRCPPVHFIGDLDPLDLATYATLVSDPAVLTASYVGVSESWFDRCEADLAQHRGWSLDRVCIRMDVEERRGLAHLLEVPLDWNRLIGPRARAMLESGRKLELEGASNPAIYSEAFGNELRRTVFDDVSPE